MISPHNTIVPSIATTSNNVILRLANLAQHLGCADSFKNSYSLLDSISLDPQSIQNALVPGAFPLEISFSECAPQTLRLDWEPFGPSLSPAVRQEQSTQTLTDSIEQYFGYGLRSTFETVSQSCRHTTDVLPDRFGAFLGTTFDAESLKELKIYYECTTEFPYNCVGTEQRILIDVLRTYLPDLHPHGLSLACNEEQVRSRMYFIHHSPLFTLDLCPVFQTLNLAHWLPASLAQIHALFGNSASIPYITVLGFRQGVDGNELKLEWLLPRRPEVSEHFFKRLQHIFWERPDTSRAFEKWMQGLAYGGTESVGHISVLGFRVSQTTGPQYSVYVSPFPANDNIAV